MTFYSDMADMALELLTEFGSDVSLVQTSTGTFDPVVGTVSGSTTTTISSKAALFDYNLRDSGIGNNDVSMIQKGDKKILLAASGLTSAPTINDTIVADGVTYSVEYIIEQKPSDEDAIYYEIHGRRNG